MKSRALVKVFLPLILHHLHPRRHLQFMEIRPSPRIIPVLYPQHPHPKHQVLRDPTAIHRPLLKSAASLLLCHSTGSSMIDRSRLVQKCTGSDLLTPCSRLGERMGLPRMMMTMMKLHSATTTQPHTQSQSHESAMLTHADRNGETGWLHTLKSHH